MMFHYFISHLSNLLKNFKALLYAIGKNSFSILILLGNQLAGRASPFNFQYKVLNPTHLRYKY